MSLPIPVSDPILQIVLSRNTLPPPPPVAILPAILVLCAPEIIAAGLCGAAAICTWMQGGKPITIRCPTLGNTTKYYCVSSAVLNFCASTLAEVLDAIRKWLTAELALLLEKMNDAIDLCDGDDACINAAVLLFETLSAAAKGYALELATRAAGTRNPPFGWRDQ